MDRESDVIIVGGGIAGAALATVLARNGIAVTMLERQEQYQDIVRGEFFGTWGITEAVRLGLGDCLLEGGAWPLRWWRQWDETVHPDDAPATDMALAHPSTPGINGPVTISHYATCAALARAAEAAGARVVRGARRTLVCPDGGRPTVRYEVAGRQRTQACRIVVGAGGRNRRTAKQAGIKVDMQVLHWGGGLAIEGLTDWPDDTQALGTEGNLNFIILPQGGGRARLYFNTDAENLKRFSGPSGARNLLQAFDLKSVPGSEEIASARPAARLGCLASTNSWTESPVTDGVVLIGDEAGMNAAILGTGLGNSLRDVSKVSEALLTESDWSPAAFRGYATERTQRMRTMMQAARVMAQLFVEFDDAAVMRRKRAFELMNSNRSYAMFLHLVLAGPDAFPKGPFGDYLEERLLTTA